MANSNRRKFWVFNGVIAPMMPALWFYTQWRRWGQKKSAASTRGMWGHVPREVRRDLQARRASGAPVIWLHAVSVGEVVAARVVARALREAAPAPLTIVFSTTTDSGFETAQAARKAGEIDAVFYYPIDAPVAVRRALNAIRPAVFASMETELWPNFLSMANARGVRCFLLNGRVSDRLLRDAPRWKALWRWMLPNFQALLMRSAVDAERMRQLIEGARISSTPRIETIGDVKLDQVSPSENSRALREHWRRQLGIAPAALLWVAGSTHPGEEEILLSAYTLLRAEFSTLRLLLAPRHIERRDEVLKLVGSHGLEAVARSAGPAQSDDTVVILDTVGELSELYAAGDVAFVGGSLIERGGHNMLEPVLRGVPVLWGPHVANFRAAASLVEAARCGNGVADGTALIAATAAWLRDEGARRAIPDRAAQALQPHRGAARRVARILIEALPARQFSVEKNL